MKLCFDDGEVPIKFSVYESYLIGDADGDGEITIDDVMAIQRVLALFDEDTDNTIARRCDVDGGGLDIKDVTAIQRKLASFDDPYKIGENAKDFGG